MKWFGRERKQEPQALTPEQLWVLERFLSLDISLAELRCALEGAFEIEFKQPRRDATGLARQTKVMSRFRLPEPGIVITREHVANALNRKRRDEITERDLVQWATVLLLNDAYVLDPGDEDLIAEWLNDISVNLDGGG